MKKLIVVLVFVVALVAVAASGFSKFMEKAVVAGVETVGPKLTQTTVELETVKLSLLSGRVEIANLEVGNPDGFETEFSMRLGHLTVDVQPTTFLKDKIVIEELRIEGPELIYETSFRGTNIARILKNVEGTRDAHDDGDTPEYETSVAKRFEIRKLVIANGKVQIANNQLKGQAIEIPLVDIEINDIGSGERGATMANVAKRVLLSINTQTIASAAKSGKFVGEQVEGTAKAVKDKVGGLLQGLKGKSSDTPNED